MNFDTFSDSTCGPGLRITSIEFNSSSCPFGNDFQSPSSNMYGNFEVPQMSASEEEYSSGDDEDYVPDGNLASDDDDEQDKGGLEEDPEEHNGINDVKEEMQQDKVDELWQSFKSDVNKSKIVQDVSIHKDAPAKDSKDETETAAQSSHPPEFNKQEIESAKSNVGEKDTVVITKVYDFAGEDVKVTKEVKRDSVEAKNHFKEQSSSNNATKSLLGRTSGILKKRPGGGIGSVLGKLGKKPKLSTLEKSKLDWNQYKEKEGIEEELQTYNKGKEGYLEKISFLERTEMRQFENERDMRLSKTARR